MVISSAQFIKLESLWDRFYEVETTPKKVKLDLLIQVAFSVYNCAKLRMLEFYYDFLLTYFERKVWQFCETDTDSVYLAFASRDWMSLMKPELAAEYRKQMEACHETNNVYEADAKYNWFPRDCCQEHRDYDKRTPGLFKVEFEGDVIVALCSKSYYCSSSEGKDKLSCKGAQKARCNFTLDTFRQVLQTKRSATCTNRGFRAENSKIYTYSQDRAALTYFYPKRIVLSDGISTTYSNVWTARVTVTIVRDPGPNTSMLAWCESDSETCSYIESSTGKECRFRGLMKLVDKWVLILHQKSDEEIRETIQTRVIRRLPLKSTRELCILIVFGHLLARRLPNPRIFYLIHNNNNILYLYSTLHHIQQPQSAPQYNNNII